MPLFIGNASYGALGQVPPHV